MSKLSGEQRSQSGSVSLQDLAQSIKRVFVRLGAYKAALESAAFTFNLSEKEDLVSAISAVLTQYESKVTDLADGIQNAQPEQCTEMLLETKELLSPNLHTWNALMFDFKDLLCREKDKQKALKKVQQRTWLSSGCPEGGPDEIDPSALLDSITEEEITSTIKQISEMKDQITVLIAHRLSTIMHADRIYVLEKGRIVETGTHYELLDEKGLYYAMWRQQIGERKYGALRQPA